MLNSSARVFLSSEEREGLLQKMSLSMLKHMSPGGTNLLFRECLRSDGPRFWRGIPSLDVSRLILGSLSTGACGTWRNRGS